MAKSIADILIEKLSSEELSILCDSWDDGSLDAAFDEVLLPKDWMQHPEKYVEPDKNIAEGGI